MIVDADYADALFRLSDSFRDTGDITEALKYITCASQVYEALSDDRYQNCIERIGGIYHQLGDLPQALSYYENYNQLQKEKLHTGTNRNETREWLAHSYQLLARVHRSIGNYTDAEQSLKKSKQILLRLRKKPETRLSAIQTLALCYERLGEVYYAWGENRKALQAYNTERRLFEQLYDVAPEIQNKFGLAIVYSKIGELKMYSGRHKQAQPLFVVFNSMMIEICDEYPANIKYALNLAWSYQFMGMFYSIEQNLMSAYNYFKLMFEQFEQLVQKNPDNVEYIEGLATSFAKLGETFVDMKQYRKALYYYQKRVLIMEELCSKYPLHPEFNNNLSGSYSHLGEVLSMLGNIDAAIGYHELEAQSCESLYQKFSDNIEYGLNLAIAYCKLGNSYLKKNDYLRADEYFRKYLHYTKILEDKAPTNIDFLGNYAEGLVAYNATSHLLTGTGDAKNYTAAYEIWTMLFKQSSNPLYQNKMAILNKIIAAKENVANLVVEMCNF